MTIDWLVLAAASIAIGTSYLFLIRIIVTKNRALDRLASSLQRAEGELLRFRSEHAKEIAELRDEYGKRTTALQGNMRDLATLLKEHGTPGWESGIDRRRK